MQEEPGASVGFEVIIDLFVARPPRVIQLVVDQIDIIGVASRAAEDWIDVHNESVQAPFSGHLQTGQEKQHRGGDAHVGDQTMVGRAVQMLYR